MALGTLKKTSQLQASLVAQLVKNQPAMWETWVQSLGWEDPLERGKATHLSILAWVAELDTTEQLSLSLFCLRLAIISSLSVQAVSNLRLSTTNITTFV